MYHLVMAMRDLLSIAGQQQGFFRADQALSAGLSRRELGWAKHKGTIDSIRYGLYRFAHFPATPLDDLYEIQALAPDGTFSHETALGLHGLSDLLPRTTHLSIPPASGFKPRPGLTVHHTRIDSAERQLRDGLWITTVARTLRDCARAGVDPDQLAGAARDALRRGVLAPSDVAALRSRYPFSEMADGR
jgi:predicted transcriptional regulator of viral defense system